jgi:MYXO-CTERM domain-containing protein
MVRLGAGRDGGRDAILEAVPGVDPAKDAVRSSARRVVAGVVVVVAAALVSRAAAATPLRGKPCAGCIASLPASPDAAPLLVVLHGDGENPQDVFGSWDKYAARRGIAVLAPACPAKEGCSSDSWWKWNGDPAWLVEQVSRVSEMHAIDRQRLWLVGWSGGGSYIGYRTVELERTFTAIVIHGGGMPPATDACGDEHVGVYFLVGDANPLHSLAVGLRDYYVRCGHDVTWTLLKKADHGGERKALEGHIDGILDWLAARARPVDSAVDSGPEAAATSVSPSQPVPPAAVSAPVSAAASPPASRPPGACSCRAAGGDVAGRPSAWALLAAALTLARRRRRPSLGAQ